ncbi:MAG: hypothetical protein ACRED8_01960 [Caulobacteraceae bacterium]
MSHFRTGLLAIAAVASLGALAATPALAGDCGCAVKHHHRHHVVHHHWKRRIVHRAVVRHEAAWTERSQSYENERVMAWREEEPPPCVMGEEGEAPFGARECGEVALPADFFDDEGGVGSAYDFANSGEVWGGGGGGEAEAGGESFASAHAFASASAKVRIHVGFHPHGHMHGCGCK